MKLDNSGIILQELSAFISHTFNLEPITSIDFVPKGEGGYAYSVRTMQGTRYFVKAEKAQVDLNLRLMEVYRLHHEYNINYVLAPILSNQRAAAEPFGEYSISLFPYVEGISVYEKNSAQDDLEAIAVMMAELHHIHSIEFSNLPREQFHNPFRNTIEKLIDSAASQSYAPGSYQQLLSGLLLKERHDIESTLQKMEDMQEQLMQRELTMCITHGDANYANILCDEQGHLHLIDWGELAIGPAERDLMSFTEEDFGPFLRSYMKKHPQIPIHPDLFEFYLYRWCLQEIADYGASLLLQPHRDEVNHHSWVEIQPYLPIHHEFIRNAVMAIRRDIEKYGDS